MSSASASALVVVGTGIRAGTDLSQEARGYIAMQDRVLYLARDPLSASIITALRPDAESLAEHYSGTTPREKSYEAMAERALAFVRSGSSVCMVLPGHPGVFAQPSHVAIARARSEGFTAIMLPAISAQDRLFCDLLVDPGEFGCYSSDATDFIAFERTPDTTAMLLLWQIGAIGRRCNPETVNLHGVTMLRDRLLLFFAPSHEVAIYEAAFLPFGEARIEWTRLESLDTAKIEFHSTLYVPPSDAPRANKEIVRELVR